MARFSEILFGLIMALGVTGTLSAATAGSAQVRTVLWSSLGCNLAWGIVDGMMFILNRLAERGHHVRDLRRLRQGAQQRLRLAALPEPPPHARITREDLAGAVAVCCLVVISTLPVALPFLIVDETRLALRISQAIGGVFLFLAGHAWGRAASYPPWAMGIAMAALGFAMVGITVALGG
jgi:VIT1/CCC1 family predicted Fe2+/Mn2+ transporter